MSIFTSFGSALLLVMLVPVWPSSHWVVWSLIAATCTARAHMVLAQQVSAKRRGRAKTTRRYPTAPDPHVGRG